MSDARKWYDDRVSRGVCVGCGDTLPEGDSRRFCPECRKRNKKKADALEESRKVHHYDANKKLDADAKAAFDLGMSYGKYKAMLYQKKLKGEI